MRFLRHWMGCSLLAKRTQRSQHRVRIHPACVGMPVRPPTGMPVRAHRPYPHATAPLRRRLAFRLLTSTHDRAPPPQSSCDPFRDCDACSAAESQAREQAGRSYTAPGLLNAPGRHRVQRHTRCSGQRFTPKTHNPTAPRVCRARRRRNHSIVRVHDVPACQGADPRL